VGLDKVVCLAILGVALLQSTGSWSTGLGVVGACMEFAFLMINFLKTILIAFCLVFFDNIGYALMVGGVMGSFLVFVKL